jgi:integration host factor subunit alpha
MTVSTSTLTRADIAEAVYRKVGLSRAESARMVEAVIARIVASLEQGEEVKLSGFGTFTLSDKRERIGRNPKTGIEARITPRRVVGFRPSQALRARVSHGD